VAIASAHPPVPLRPEPRTGQRTPDGRGCARPEALADRPCRSGALLAGPPAAPKPRGDGGASRRVFSRTRRVLRDPRTPGPHLTPSWRRRAGSPESRGYFLPAGSFVAACPSPGGGTPPTPGGRKAPRGPRGGAEEVPLRDAIPERGRPNAEGPRAPGEGRPRPHARRPGDGAQRTRGPGGCPPRPSLGRRRGPSVRPPRPGPGGPEREGWTTYGGVSGPRASTP